MHILYVHTCKMWKQMSGSCLRGAELNWRVCLSRKCLTRPCWFINTPLTQGRTLRKSTLGHSLLLSLFTVVFFGRVGCNNLIWDIFAVYGVEAVLEAHQNQGLNVISWDNDKQQGSRLYIHNKRTNVTFGRTAGHPKHIIIKKHLLKLWRGKAEKKKKPQQWWCPEDENIQSFQESETRRRARQSTWKFKNWPLSPSSRTFPENSFFSQIHFTPPCNACKYQMEKCAFLPLKSRLHLFWFPGESKMAQCCSVPFALAETKVAIKDVPTFNHIIYYYYRSFINHKHNLSKTSRHVHILA